MSKSYPINCAGRGAGKLPQLSMDDIHLTSDLDKAKLCLAILQSMKVKRASTLDALEDEIEYIKAIVG